MLHAPTPDEHAGWLALRCGSHKPPLPDHSRKLASMLVANQAVVTLVSMFAALKPVLPPLLKQYLGNTPDYVEARTSVWVSHTTPNINILFSHSPKLGAVVQLIVKHATRHQAAPITDH